MINELNIESIISHLQLKGRYWRDIDLSTFSSWKIGGIGRLLVEPASVDELSNILKFCSSKGIPHLIIGQTTNILFDDLGYAGILIKLGSEFSKILRENVDYQNNSALIDVGAAAWTPAVARRSALWGLTGIEHIVGIPGTFGGLVSMNGGSQRKGIGSSIVSVDTVLFDGTIRTIAAKDCLFAYRKSIFQEEGSVIVSAKLLLATRKVSCIQSEMIGILKSRNAKFPRKYPNCGSVFLSNPIMYAAIGTPGAAIEKVGLKGKMFGGAMISEQHANFIVNYSKASARDVLHLIHEARSKVFDATGYMMDTEVKFLSYCGNLKSAHEISDAIFIR